MRTRAGVATPACTVRAPALLRLFSLRALIPGNKRRLLRLSTLPAGLLLRHFLRVDSQLNRRLRIVIGGDHAILAVKVCTGRLRCPPFEHEAEKAFCRAAFGVLCAEPGSDAVGLHRISEALLLVAVGEEARHRS